MRKKLLFTAFVLMSFFCCQSSIHAQVNHGTAVADSTIINFDTLTYSAPSSSGPGKYIVDTAAMGLWEIGNTSKKFFAKDTPSVFGIMTDTLHTYPVNTNSWFTLKMFPYGGNTIVAFWHKYQTSPGHDGGTVEYATNKDTTWKNVLGDCNMDYGGPGAFGLHTENFYGKNDTLASGVPAFSGTSAGWQYSQIQFYNRIALKGTASCMVGPDDSVYIRFRFISDSIPDSLDGWVIGKMVIQHVVIPGYVSNVKNTGVLDIYPNPSVGSFTFPALDDNEGRYTLELSDVIGQKIVSIPYTHNVDLRNYPDGLYFYRVSDGTTQYTGKLLKQ